MTLPIFLVSAGFTALAWAGPTMSVADQKGRSVEIELISIASESVTFRRAGKEYTLPLSQFDSSSQERIRKEGAALPPPPLKLTPEVIIGKRRNKVDSYYMEKQDITCTVKLTNTAPAQTAPLNGHIIFFGENQKEAGVYNVLSTQTFDAQILPGKTFVKEMEGFSTTYDSDNKGYGNVGGFQYLGYLLVLTDSAGNIVFDQTTNGGIRQTLNNKPSLLKTILTYRKDQKLSNKLEPM